MAKTKQDPFKLPDLDTPEAIDKRTREESKRQRKESIKNARKRQEFFGYRNV